MRLKFLNRDDQENDVMLEFLLDAQRRVASADSSYFRAVVDYSLALLKVHFTRGTMLEFMEVYLAEDGPLPGPAGSPH